MSPNPLFSGPVAEPGEPSRLRRAFIVQTTLMLLVVVLGGWMLHQQSDGADHGTPDQAAVVARELLDAMGQVGLHSRQELAVADSLEARRRSDEARERVKALELWLHQGLGQPPAAWLPPLLDSVAAAREDAYQWLDQARRQASEGQTAEAARTLQTRAQLAEARWRAQAEELQRRIDLQLRSQQLQRQEASQRLLLQWFGWSLTAVALAGWLGWSLQRRARFAWEKQLRAVPASQGGSRAEPTAANATALTFVRPLAPVTQAQAVPGATPTAAGTAGTAGPATDGGQAAAAQATAGLAGHPQRRATDRLQRQLLQPGFAGNASGASAEQAAGRGAASAPASSRPVAPATGQAESARQVIARAKAAADRSAAGLLPKGMPAPVPAAASALTSDGAESAAAAATFGQPLDPALLRTAADTAERGSSLVSQVVANIEDIGASGRRIAEIVAVIDGIAFQTNLLALNAAVEAARSRQGSAAAGAAADVRSLAQRASQAAREIRALVQAGGDGSAGAVAQALQQDTGTTMEALLVSVQQAAEIVTQVHKAAEGRSEPVAAPVRESVEQLDRMQRNHAALAEQSAGTAESLRQQAERLQKVLGAFKLLQQTQQAAWGAHTAIRDARQKASSSANDSGFGSLGAPTWRPDPGASAGDANGTDGGWRPF